jgi:hypothetical protein
MKLPHPRSRSQSPTYLLLMNLVESSSNCSRRRMQDKNGPLVKEVAKRVTDCWFYHENMCYKCQVRCAQVVPALLG